MGYGKTILSRAFGWSLLLHAAIASLLLAPWLPEGVQPASRSVTHARLLVPQSGETKVPVPLAMESIKGGTTRRSDRSPHRRERMAMQSFAASSPADGNLTAQAPLRAELAGSVSDLQPVSADGIRRYRLSLGRAVRLHKSNLSVLRTKGWEGEVGVVVGALAGSGWPQAELSQSSGIAALDNEALQMARQAIQGAAVPEVLQGKAFSLTLLIRFSVDD